jgi:hypothetical protein
VHTTSIMGGGRGAGGGGVIVLAVGTVALLLGCGGSREEAQPGGDGIGGGGSPSGSAGGPVTYYEHVLPLVAGRCGGCHAPGGLAPFSLLTYEAARPLAARMAAATRSGEMPPWPPAAGCGDFQGVRALSPDEIAILGSWADGGAPAGEPARTPPAAGDGAGAGIGLGAPSATLDPGAAYQPKADMTDDYRCFLVDPGLSSAQNLIGFNVHPGTPASVHHVLLFAVAPADVAAAQAKDAADPGVGWTCFAGTGVGSGINAPLTIGGWVPGSGESAFPPGTGIGLATGTWIVMQVHYNLLVQRQVSDRTTVDLYYASGPVATPALILPLANQTFVIPAGAAAHTVTADLPVLGAWSLWGVAPHMHLYGTEIKVWIEHPDGSSTCAIDIPRWDFHWQQFYYYRQAIPVADGDVVRMSCTYDNSADNQPVVAGHKVPSMPVGWGEKTTDEMCLSFGYVAPR